MTTLQQAKSALKMAHAIQEEVNEILKLEKKEHDLLTIREVARILRVDDTTVRRWVKQGILEAITLPHVGTRETYRIKRETVEKILGEPIGADNV
jgi:excisionase family DNA binding protein